MAQARPIKKWTPVSFVFQSVWLGVLSTAFLDGWNLMRALMFDIPLTKYELIGRWLLYMLEGQFAHDAIRSSDARAGELIAGWAGHYTIGVLFAKMLLAIWGRNWLRHPRLIPAMVIGMVTVLIPYFVMQPGMGAGIAGSLTPDPSAARMKVVVSHIVFGVGLYLAGWLVAGFRRIGQGRQSLNEF